MLRDGENLGPYRVMEQIGSGGMATVYKAYHPKLDRYVSIKMMHQAFLEDKSFQARFEREAQIVARLDHPNIVRIYDFSEHERQPYLVMKFIEGRTLKALLMQGNPLQLGDIYRLMTPLADALTYAHEHGVLHRDIKPSNIIIDDNGVPYLTDFGLARIAQAGESSISHDMLLGTPHYISPEQAKGNTELDARTDIYSLGIVLYELVVGRVPFTADTPYAIVHDHIYTPLPLPRRINPDIPEAVERVLLKALAKNPSDRFLSARDMMKAFGEAINTAGDVELKPDRASDAAASIAQLRKEADTMHEAGNLVIVPPSPHPPPPPAIPAPIEHPNRPQPPDPSQNPIGFARWQAKVMVGDNSERIEKFVGEERARKFSKAMDKLESQVQAKISDGSIRLDLTGTTGSKVVTIPAGSASYSSDSAVRRRVEERFNKRKEFNIHLGIFVLVNVLLWVIWAFSGSIIGGEIATAPWPAIPLFGWGAGLVAHGIETTYKTGRRGEQRDLAVDDEMSAIYGDDWAMTVTEAEHKQVEKRVLKQYDKRLEFYQHVSVYVMINVMLWVIWAFSGAIVGGIATAPWPLIPMLGWGIGLFAHWADMMGQTGRAAKAREDAIEREIERQRGKSKRKNEDFEAPVRLTEEGELTDSFVQEWEDDEKRKRR